MNTVHKTTSAFHLQANGAVERLNHTLATILAMYIDEEHRAWDIILLLHKNKRQINDCRLLAQKTLYWPQETERQSRAQSASLSTTPLSRLTTQLTVSPLSAPRPTASAGGKPSGGRRRYSFGLDPRNIRPLLTISRPPPRHNPPKIHIVTQKCKHYKYSTYDLNF